MITSTDERSAMIAAIERVEWQVTEAMTVELYRGPFWKARFGERGRRATRQDAAANLKRLITAIAADNPESLANYYQWLRGLLVYRGMCTRHLRETLDLTGRLLSQALPSQWKQIITFHNGGYQGLRYTNPASAALQDQETEIAIAVTNRLFSPARLARTHMTVSEATRSAYLRDNLYHLSFLADAVEVGAPVLFENYLTFMAGFLPGEGVPLSDLHDSLHIMSEEIYYSLPSETYQPLLALLDQSSAYVK